MSKIGEFYGGKSILLTGVTGFIGKVLIEKILYSCSEIKQVFLIIRANKNQNIDQRLKTLVNSPAFDRIRNEKPEMFQKLLPIQGDIDLPDFGISEENLEKIINETEIIFNVSGLVNFEEPIQSAFRSNTGSFKNLVDIAKKMKNLQILLHVSTGFCFRQRENIQEIYYANDDNWIINDFENAEDHLLNVEKNNINGHLSTYSYTKRLTEIIANEEFKSLPICLIRPSIVDGSLSEPMPGWIDSMMSPADSIISVAKGLKRCFNHNKFYKMETIPVDSVARAMISIVWDLKTKYPSKSFPAEMPIYNLTTPDYPNYQNYMRGDNYQKSTEKILTKNPFKPGIWFPNVTYFEDGFYYKLNVLLFQFLPAFILDGFLMILGKKTHFVEDQKKINNFQEVFAKYSRFPLSFAIDKIMEIDNSLTGDDEKEFRAFPKEHDYEIYFKNLIEGIRKYLLHESVDDIPKSKAIFVILKLLDVFVKTSFYIGLLMLVYDRFFMK